MNGKKYIISCSIVAEETFLSGEPVNILFRLTNQDNRMLYILEWYTPLEGIAGEIFRVTRDGEEIAYTGRLMKRGDPVLEEYTTLEPGESVSTQVDLAGCYDMTPEAQYRVEFTSRLFDITDDRSSIPRKRSEHRMQELPCNSAIFEIMRD